MRTRSRGRPIVMWTWLVGMGCQEPFDEDRHDLVGFRIAAMEITERPSQTARRAAGPDTFAPRVAVVVDGRPWSDVPVTFAWHWVSDPADVEDPDPDPDPDGAAGIGPSPSLALPLDDALLAVVATSPDGEIHRAAIDVGGLGGAHRDPLPPISLGTLDLSLDTVQDEDLALEARQRRSSTPATVVAPGGFARLALPVDAGVVRWMADAGTFFEVERDATDWVAGKLRLDDGEIDGEPVEMGRGTATVIALVVDPPAPPRFRARDVLVGEAGAGWWIGQRWLPAVGALPEDLGTLPGTAVRGRLVADDASPTGIALADPVVVPQGEATGSGWGTLDLGCEAPVAGPFQPGWLLDQRCSRSQVVERVVYVSPDPESGP